MNKRTLALRAGIVSGLAAAVLIVGAFAISGTVANAQTPSPSPAPQQTQPATPQDTQPDGTQPKQHNGDCPHMGNDSSGSSSSSSGPMYRGGRAAGNGVVYRE